MLRRRNQLLLLLLIGLALLLRIWYLHINPLSPQFSNADDGDYYRRALRLAISGQYVDDAWLIRPPFHVLVFAGLIRLGLQFGGSPAAGVALVQYTQLLLGVLMVPLCYALASRLFNPRAGLLFAGFWAIWFPFVELPATLFSEPIYLFLWTLHLWLLLRFDDHGRRRDLLLSGLTLGMAALSRSPALYALAFAVPWLLWRAWSRLPAGQLSGRAHLSAALRSAIPAFGLLLLSTLVVVAPWTVRNWVVYRQFIPIDTLGPINLWLDLGSAGERDAKIRALEAVPQAERQALATREALALLRADPLRPFRPMWGTFRHIWKAQFVEDYFVKSGFFTRPLREAAPLGLLGDLLWLVFSFAGFAGFLHPTTDRPFKIVTGLWLVYSIFTVLIFHVEPRYLLSIWLLLGLYGAAMLSGLPLPALRRRPMRIGLISGALLALALLFITYRDYPTIIGTGLRREAAMRGGDAAYRRADYPAAEAAYRQALALDPDFADAQVALALALGAQGRAVEALEIGSPGASRRSALVRGLMLRAAGETGPARELLSASETRAGEDAQAWSLREVRPEPRTTLVVGDDALDLGYIQGFGGSEDVVGRSMRWLLGQGFVSLPLPRPLAVGDSIVLDLAAPLPGTGPVEMVVNGQWRVHFSAAPTWRRYHFVLPPGLAGARHLRVELQSPTVIPALVDPASDDARSLGVMLHRVSLVP